MPGLAQAGAWVPPAGTQQTIATASLGSESGSGAQPAIEFYAEQGLIDGVALVIVAGMHGQDGLATGDERLTALRFDLPLLEGWNSSTQIGWVEGPMRDAEGDFTAIESRFAIGRGWNNGVWIDGSYAVRECEGTVSARWDAAVGYRLSNGDRVIGKMFGEDAVCGLARDRAQVSYVRNLGSGLGLEFGWRETISSRDGWDSHGVVIGIWRRF